MSDSEEESLPMSRSGSQRQLRDMVDESEDLDLEGEGNNNSSSSSTPRRPSQPPPPIITVSVTELERIIKRAQAPLVEQMRVLSKKVLDMSKQVARVDSTVSGLDKKNSNILEAIDKKKSPLTKLLTHIGCIQIKSFCVQNMHLEAHSAEEVKCLEDFLVDAKENNWIVGDSTSAKLENDIKLSFRAERHVLKQQIRDHLKLDYGGNASADMAAQMMKTRAYLMRHIGDITPEVELVLHQLAFILAKYFNSKKVLVDSEDKKIQRVARKSLYDYLHKRMRKDGSTVEELKLKIARSLTGGFKYSEVRQQAAENRE